MWNTLSSQLNCRLPGSPYTEHIVTIQLILIHVKDCSQAVPIGFESGVGGIKTGCMWDET